MNGGDKLGEGVHGVAYDVVSDEGESFYSILQDKPITKITLITEDSKYHELTTQEDIHKFINFLKSAKDKVAKFFKKLIYIDIKKDFEAELDSNKQVSKAYKPKSAHYTTVTGLTGFLKSPISGCIIELNHSKKMYVSFGTRCSNMQDINPDKFILDILESLSKLQTKGYSHNDIKLNNILICNDKEYKLIDWGSLQPKEVLRYTSTSFTNPLKWYVKGYSAVSSNLIMDYTINPQSSKLKFIRTKLYKDFRKRIYKEFYEVIRTHTREEIKQRQADTYDTFMFGLTILELIDKLKLEDPKYLELSNRLTSLVDPLDAKKGLKLAKKLLAE
jgi:serine/threonine protein kinase